MGVKLSAGPEALVARLEETLEVNLLAALDSGNGVEDDGEEGEDDSGLARPGGTLDQRDGLFLERRLEGGELAVCSREKD